MSLYGQNHIKVSYYIEKFCGHRCCGSEDITILVCHVISKNHEIKGLCDFLGMIPSKKVRILPGLVTIDTLIVEIHFFQLITWCRKTTYQKTMWRYTQESIKVSYHPAKFGGKMYCGSGDIMILVSHLYLFDDVTGTSLFSVIWMKLVNVPASEIWCW